MNLHRSRRPRMQRWLRRLLGLSLTLLLLGLSCVFALLHNLDRLWVRERLAALALANSGLEISYGAVDLHTWSELDVRDLVVRSPIALRAVAPELLRIARLRLSWWRVPPFGWRPALRTLEVQGLTLYVARDERGRTSFDAIPSTGAPLSQRAKQLLGTGFPIPEIRLNGITLTLIQNDQGTITERDSLRGLALSVSATPHLGGARLELAMGNANAPLVLTLERSRTGASDTVAIGRAFLAGTANSAAASAILDVRVTSQNLAPRLAVEHLVHLQASAKFEPSAGRVELAVTELAVADDTAKSEAKLELPDRGVPRLQHAAGEIDAVRLVRLAAPWTPEIALTSGRVGYRIDDLPLDGPAATTLIALDAELTGAHLPLANGSLRLARGQLSLHLRPNGARLSADGDALFDGLELRSEEGTLRGRELALKLEGQRANGGELSGQAELRFASLVRDGANPALARLGRVVLHARDVYADASSPLTARGELGLDVAVSSLETGASLRCIGSNLKLHAETPLAVHERFALSSNFSAEKLLFSRAGRRLVELPLHGELTVKDLKPDLEQPVRSSGAVHALLDAGAIHAVFDALERDQALDYELNASAPRLTDARAFAPDGLAQQLPWERMAFELQAKGRVTRASSASPELEQRFRLQLTGAALHTVGSRALTFALNSRGGGVRQQGELDVAAEGLRAGDIQLGDEHLKAGFEFDRSRPALQVAFSSERLVKSALQLSAAFDRELQAVTFRVNGRVSQLASLAPLLARVHELAGFELSKLALRLDAHGSLSGVVSSARANGPLSLAPRPLATAKFSSTVELEATALRWADGDRALWTPAATLRATLQADAEQRRVQSDLVAGEIGFGMRRRWLRAIGLHDQGVLSATGPLSTSTLELVQHATLDAVEQNFAPLYTLGDVRAEVHVRREPDGLIRIDDVQIDNRAAGTALRVQGGLDLGSDLRRLSVRTTVTQDLSRLCNRRELFTASGTARMNLSVESPDFRVFHDNAELELEHAYVRLPNKGIAIDGIDGEVPIVLDLTYGRKGVELLRGAQINPYPTLRFADQHPLLSKHSFISIAKLATPWVSVAPFAANLKVEQNIVSLSQLEMGVRGGSITGDGVFDWNGPQSTFQADVRASGVLSSHGEPFDGNAALLVDIGDRSVDGRADILRIGRRHLLDLLDLQDPERADAGMNSIRSALHFGYPERVRIAFKHGFASAGVSFGGLASLLRVDDVRGIPIGPLMERLVSSFTAEAEQ